MEVKNVGNLKAFLEVHEYPDNMPLCVEGEEQGMFFELEFYEADNGNNDPVVRCVIGFCESERLNRLKAEHAELVEKLNMVNAQISAL